VHEGTDALGDLWTRCRGALVAYANRIVRDRAEAEDVVHDVYLRIPKTPTTQGEGPHAGWLYAATYRVAVDRLRARRRRGAAVARAPGRAAAPPASERAEAGDEARRLQESLHELPEPYRSAVTLRYLEGLDYPEIARRMNALERTTRTWVGRGLAMLRTRLSQDAR
jgi:RNA polymerase sigma-70 factor (ECF subfamily)